MIVRLAGLGLGLLVASSVAPTQSTSPQTTVAAALEVDVSDAATKLAADRALSWIIAHQRENGAFGLGTLDSYREMGFSVETYHAWQVAAHSLACLALLTATPTDERRAALDRGLAWFATSRLPLRGSDWDNDAVWSYLYGSELGVRVVQDDRYVGTELGAKVGERGRLHLDRLLANQIPEGGFGYYDDPPFTRRPKWGTSFCTALVLPTLKSAFDLDWFTDREALLRSVSYVRACELPNGAYAYDLRPVPRRFVGESIDAVRGSLGRIQVCNWARAAVGDPDVDADRLERGIQQFFAHHEFLAVARMRPVPHEAYYANAGYFFLFGHYYAALVIEQLPEQPRVDYRAQLRRRLLPTQRTDGSFCDFICSSYTAVAGSAFAAMALAAGLPGDAR